MSSFPPQTGLVVLAAMSIAAGMFFATAGAFPAHQAVQVSGFVVVAMLTSLLPRQKSAIEDRRTLPLSFVVAFTSLLLLGPNVATLVAAAGPFARWVMDSERRHNSRRMVVNVATVMTAIQVAGLVHRLFGGTSGHFVWPWQALPLAAAVLGYCVVTTSAVEVLVPFLKRQPMPRAWPASLLHAVPECVVAASVAVVIVELIDQRRWDLLLVAAVPVCLAYRGHWAFLSRFQDEQRQHEIIDSFEEGMCVLDSDGRVTLWSDTAERIIGCSRERALGCLLVAAVPALRKSELPRSINEVLTTGNPGSLANVALPSTTGTRMVQVKILPVVGGATLLWQDVTERRRAEHALKRNEERFALAAEGAHDGLWEWDVRAEEFYFSGRWRALLGLPATPGVGRPEDWIDRVHEDDRGALQEAIDAHLTGKTEHLVHEHRIRHEDGTYRPVLCRGVAVKSPGRGGSRIAGSLRDTTDRSMTEEGMHSGFVDSLTGLSNRAVFVRGLGRRLDERKQRRGGSTFAVLYLDLDRFKLVNDSLGHLVGDELLIAASRRLETCLRPGDALARLGGDEFAILLGGLGDEQQANAIAFRIQAALSAPFTIGGREVFTTASIGIAFGLAHYTNAHEMMRDADTAMYHAKSRGKARHELFDADMHARARDRLGLESDLRHAVSTNDFEVHYQPIVSLASGMCIGFESLARWTRNGQAVSPATFIPIAEELGIIEPLGTWVLQQACRAFADWQRRYPGRGLEFITVNVSARQLMQQNFLRIIERAVEHAELQPSDVRLEITETALMDSPDSAAEVLRDLRDFGVKIYLDDFGTGCSSLSHLHKLPVDVLKIDRSFVTSLLIPDRPAMVESILALARTLKTGVVAEGIEHEAQARELERLGCTHAQGYLFSRPLAVRAVEELLTANQPLGPKQGRPPASLDSLTWPVPNPARRVSADVPTPVLVRDLPDPTRV